VAHMDENITLSTSARREIGRLVDRYLATSSLRDRRLFEVLMLDGYYHTTLDSVDPQHFESALLAKLQLGMIITLCDDLADHPRHRDPQLLAALYRLNINSTAPHPDLANERQRRTYELACSLMHELTLLVRDFPHGNELASLLAFDIHQFYQANRYAEIISDSPHLASLDELRVLGPHNMGMVPAYTIDLMASRGVDMSQLGRCREVFLLGQRVGRISNVLATYERELAEGDRTNELIVGATQRTLDEHRRGLFDEAERLIAEIEANKRAVTAFRVTSYVQSLRRLHTLYFAMRGIV